MPSRKRAVEALEEGHGDAQAQLLDRIRNMWQFANLCQWIYIFGRAARIDESIDIEDIEMECLKPTSTLMGDIALSLIKLVSSHRGITPDILDEQTRKQFLARAPDNNPFGLDNESPGFADMDVFTKIEVLQQLTKWAMINPDRIRYKMEEQKDSEQAEWRIEPYGWDSQDRTYFVLDDNRVYRLSEVAEPPKQPPPKKQKKQQRVGHRTSGRHQRNQPIEDDQDDNEQPKQYIGEPDKGLGNMRWECLAVTLDQVKELIDGFRKSRDSNEKVLRKQLEDHLVPILEEQEESRKRKELRRERELLNLAKMATAKRSSRLAGKFEKQQQDDKEREDERLRHETEKAKRREENQRLDLERQRDYRLHSREKRLEGREGRRARREEDPESLEPGSSSINGNGRTSARQQSARQEQNQQGLMDLGQDDDWEFDCICGLHGQVDDGSHSVACERCNVWQHSSCLGVNEEEAESPDFHLICDNCSRHRQNAHDATTQLQPSDIVASPLAKPTKIVIELQARPAPHSASTGVDSQQLSLRQTDAPASNAIDQVKPDQVKPDQERGVVADQAVGVDPPANHPGAEVQGLELSANGPVQPTLATPQPSV